MYISTFKTKTILLTCRANRLKQFIAKKQLMNKLVLSAISFLSICAILGSCAKADNTAPLPPFFANFTLPDKSFHTFPGSYVASAVSTNAASVNRPLDSSVVITGHIYKPGTTNDSILSVNILIQRYHTGIGAIAIDNDTFANAYIVDPTGAYHMNGTGAVFFSASTAYGAVGTFNFKCDDGTNITDGRFVASWRGQH